MAMPGVRNAIPLATRKTFDRAIMTTKGEMAESNGHAQTLREVASELYVIRELFTAKIDAVVALMDERDRLYKERDESRRTAVDAALVAMDKQTRASFEASEKAIVKAEDSQREYNIRSNEFRGQLDDQAKTLLPRAEAGVLFKGLEEKIRSSDDSREKKFDIVTKDITALRESRSNLDGRTAILGIVGMALVAIAVAWLTMSFRTAPATVTPQVIYVPAPGPAGSVLPTTPPASPPR
jgi:hypothetical protein